MIFYSDNGNLGECRIALNSLVNEKTNVTHRHSGAHRLPWQSVSETERNTHVCVWNHHRKS